MHFYPSHFSSSVDVVFDSQTSIDHIFPNYRLSIPKENSLILWSLD